MITSSGLPPLLLVLVHHIHSGRGERTHTAWLRRVWTALRPGSDLSRVRSQWYVWLLTEELPRHPCLKPSDDGVEIWGPTFRDGELTYARLDACFDLDEGDSNED